MNPEVTGLRHLGQGSGIGTFGLLGFRLIPHKEACWASVVGFEGSSAVSVSLHLPDSLPGS